MTSVGVMASAVNSAAAPVLPVTSGLELWLDADDAATFSYSTGTVVSAWFDKSGFGHHQSQGAVADRPSRSGTQNGRASVVFGTSDQMTTTVVSTAVDNVTLFVACKRTGGGVQSVVYQMGKSTDGYGLALRANSANIGLLRGNIAMTTTATPDPAAAGVLSLRRAAGTWSLRLDQVATNLALTAAPNAPATNSLLVSTAHPFEGEVYEVVFYGRALSDTERQQVEAYLKTKWGTP